MITQSPVVICLTKYTGELVEELFKSPRLLWFNLEDQGKDQELGWSLLYWIGPFSVTFISSRDLVFFLSWRRKWRATQPPRLSWTYYSWHGTFLRNRWHTILSSWHWMTPLTWAGRGGWLWGDCEGEVPKLPLPGPPQPGVQAAAVHVDHHQDGGHVAEHVRLSIFKYLISFCRRKSLIDTIK